MSHMTKLNSYFQLSNKYGGTYLKLFPPKGSGTSIVFNELSEYLTRHNILDYDINILKTALNNLVEDTEIKIWDYNIGAINETLNIIVSEDRLTAIARFYPPSTEGRLLTEQEIMNIIRKNIKQGIKEQNIYLFLANRRYCEDIIIAKGKKPTEGIDAKIIYLFNQDTSLKPSLNENGTVDFKKLNILNSVEKDQVLAVLQPERPGISGIDIYGKILQPKNVRKKKLKPGKNAYISENGLSLISAVNGHVKFEGDRVWVSDVYKIKDSVDPSTGDIRYSGSVYIPGNVLTGYSVYVNGDIIVDGLVEGAHIEAGGNITIQGGIKGGGRGYLKAGGNIIVRFIESSEVLAGGDVICDEILHSKVTAKGKIRVTSGKGLITGSLVRSEKIIYTKTVGSLMGADTSLEVSYDFDLFSKCNELREEINEKKTELMKLLNIVNNYKTKIKNGESFTKKQLDYLKKITQQCVDYNNDIKTLTSELEQGQRIQDENVTKMRDWCIIVEKQVYSGVYIKIGPSGYRVENDIYRTKFIREKGEIKITAV